MSLSSWMRRVPKEKTKSVSSTLSIYLSIYLPFYLPTYISIYLSINPSIFLTHSLSRSHSDSGLATHHSPLRTQQPELSNQNSQLITHHSPLTHTHTYTHTLTSWNLCDDIAPEEAGQHHGLNPLPPPVLLGHTDDGNGDVNSVHITNPCGGRTHQHNDSSLLDICTHMRARRRRRRRTHVRDHATTRVYVYIHAHW